MRWVTSDHHFFHKNILKLQPESRQYENLEDMHDKMITNWNNTVQPDDEVYILGDFSFSKWQLTKTVLYQLNGGKHLVKGNHDHWVTTEARFSLESVTDYLELTVNKTFVVMMHYPLVSWNRKSRGSLHLHGHTHGRYKAFNSFDVGVDNSPNNNLWDLDTLIERMNKERSELRLQCD